jgi:hypothetical protein
MILRFSILFFLFFLNTIYSQTLGYDKMRPSQIVTKNGDTINVIGKLKSNVFKYKRYSTSKTKKINYSEIKFIKIRFEKDIIKTFKFFSVLEKNKIIPVEELVKGNKISLYGITSNLNFQVGSGVSTYQMSTEYYTRKPKDKKISKLGRYNPPFGNIKDKLKNIFSDCNELLQKVEKKEFKIRSDIQIMFEFYNKNCQ